MSTKSTNFEILKSDSRYQARTACLYTPSGKVHTPVFCPVGTAAAVKGITPQQLKELGCSMLLVNTYHLMLRPGADTIQKIGGIHKFMAWNGPIITDSGGFQVLSLSKLTTITDRGLEFASHIDGQKVTLEPASAIHIQNQLASDIIMSLDQCPKFPCERKLLKEAVDRTILWAKICKDAHKKSDQQLFGIVQGGIDLDLRQYCANELVKMDFDGFAIGGLGIGEGLENMLKAVAWTNQILPFDKPRYLMGVGTVADIIAAVKLGVDIFDCVLPTRNARNAYAFTHNGPVRLRNSAYVNDPSPLDDHCDCYCCKNFTKAALRHYFNIGEMLGPILVSLHNIRFYQNLMAQIRQAIEQSDFSDWADQQLKNLSCCDNLQ